MAINPNASGSGGNRSDYLQNDGFAACAITRNEAGTELQVQVVQRAPDLRQRPSGHVRIPRGRSQVVVARQGLNVPDVRFPLQQVRCIRMPQPRLTYFLPEPCPP